MTNHTQPLQYVQRQFQQAYVQRQPQFQQAYVQRQPQPQQVVYVQYQQQKVNVQPKFQSFQYVQYQQQANVQYQQQVVYVQPQQVFYSNPPQQVAYNYLPTKFVYNNVHAQNLQNDPQQQQTFHNHLPTKLSESIYISEEEAEKIRKDLDKKFPKPDNLNRQKQPIQNNNNKYNQNLFPKNQREPVVKEAFNDKKGNRFMFLGVTLAESIYLPIGNDDLSPIAKNFKSIDYRSSESTKLSLEAPSSKFNISPQNQVFQLFKLNALNR